MFLFFCISSFSSHDSPFLLSHCILFSHSDIPLLLSTCFVCSCWKIGSVRSISWVTKPKVNKTNLGYKNPTATLYDHGPMAMIVGTTLALLLDLRELSQREVHADLIVNVSRRSGMTGAIRPRSRWLGIGDSEQGEDELEQIGPACSSIFKQLGVNSICSNNADSAHAERESSRVVEIAPLEWILTEANSLATSFYLFKRPIQVSLIPIWLCQGQKTYQSWESQS